jgi:hypothetical protein
MVGTYLDDGSTEFDNFTRKIDTHRLVVVELGTTPLGQRKPRNFAPQPVSHRYRSRDNKHSQQVQSIGRKVSGLTYGNEGEEITKDDEEFLAEEARRDQKLFNPQPTKMEKKGERRRKGGADWGFD